MERTLLNSGLVILLLMGCASQGYPPGGPVDKQPPEISAMTPNDGSVEVSINTKIEIEFTERMNKTSVKQSIFISPYPGGDLILNWRGRRLKIKFPESLKPDRTYVITIGSGCKDLRENAMPQSRTIAFSTGKKLDSCGIKGQIFSDSKVEGIQIWAYLGKDSITFNPSKTYADYVTQSDKDGTYQFLYLARGMYRLFAINDRDANQLYDPEYDWLGISNRDIELAKDSTHAEQINFRIAVRDTTPPNFESALALDQNHIDLRFSEPLAMPGTTEPLNFRVFAENDTLTILHVYQNYRNPSYIHLLTAAQNNKDYQVVVAGLTDLVGYTVATAKLPVIVTGNSNPDTTGPRLIFTEPPDSSFSIPTTNPIMLVFSEPMDTLSVNNHFALFDSTDMVVAGNWTWKNMALGYFHPRAALQSKMAYHSTLVTDSVRDYSGNSLADTSFSLRFTTINVDTLTSISGTITDADTQVTGNLYLQIKSVTGVNTYSTQLESPGTYLFNNIMPDIYLLSAFRDEDGNNRYTWGEPYPFVPAERFYQFPDSIKVRPRWPNDGNDFVLPE